MACSYCLSTNITVSMKSGDGYKYFCDEVCGNAHLREINQEDMQHNVCASLQAILLAKKDLIGVIKEDISEEQKIEKASFLTEYMRCGFASKLFYQALLKRESLETITRLSDLHVKALQHVMDIMFCSDFIKESYPSQYYHIGRVLSPHSVGTYKLISEAYAKY